MNLGFSEVLIILVIAMLFLGPGRLPGLGKSLGEAIRGFKKGMDDKDDDKTAAAETASTKKSSPPPDDDDTAPLNIKTKSKDRADG